MLRLRFERARQTPRRAACPRGHAIEGENALHYRDRAGRDYWRCRACHLAQQRADWARKHAGEPARRPSVPGSVLCDEVPFLRSIGITEQEIAARLGMRFLTYRGALRRNGLTKERTA